MSRHKKTKRAQRKKILKKQSYSVFTKPSNQKLISLAFILVLVFSSLFVLMKMGGFKKIKNSERSPTNMPARNRFEPQFKKEGELLFKSGKSGRLIKKIDIEIADNFKETTLGLMYRTSMPDSAGMLFIFEKSEPQSFWMKNTIIALDIIFVNEKNEIVTIQRNTTPYSEQSIPSDKDAIYVVEVNAGFCDKYNIVEGDLIDWWKV